MPSLCAPELGSPAVGSRVLHEADPPAGALVGRMSFRSYNAETDKLQAEAEAEEARLQGGPAPAVAVAVSDAEMAAALKRRSGEEPAGKRRKGEAASGFVKPPPFRTTE